MAVAALKVLLIIVTPVLTSFLGKNTPATMVEPVFSKRLTRLRFQQDPMGKHTASRSSLPRCDHVVEERQHRTMTPCVVHVNERGGTVTPTQGFVPKLVSRIEVISKFLSRRDHCAETAPLHSAREG
jgi:hypothetical protein